MKKTLSVDGMMCEHCQSSVEKALSSVPGVKKVKVDLKSKKATVESKEEISDTILIEAVKAAGFEASAE
ncbi:MAG: heavy-metal-associated domain-containing protein [Clostridia bacterium]|nr:heavy-metal-associated domain-containing protein [Clostridia bacterium]